MLKKKGISITIILSIIIQICIPIFTQEVKATDTTRYINNAQDLIEFANEVNNGNTFEGITIKLTNDITLNCDETNQWTPIGWCNAAGGNNISSSKDKAPFKGTFDGNNNYISGIYINSDKNHVGLFGINEGTIENLTLIDSHIETTKAYSGGITGFSNGKVINCVNYANVVNNSSSGASGGIIGYSDGSTVVRCRNYGDIQGTTGYIGGCIGYTWGSYVYLCYNAGNMETTAFGTGGIIGYCQTSTVYECANSGNIKGSNLVGGITAVLYKFADMKYCYNTGNISSDYQATTSYLGGISGSVSLSSDSCVMENCYSVGKIEKNDKAKVGALIGEYEEGKISNCYYMEGNITGIGEGKEDTIGSVESRTSAQMKGKNFLDTLNSGITQQDINSERNKLYNLYNEEGKIFVYKGHFPIFHWIIINGDINGDGKISITDLSLLKRHIIGQSKLTGEKETVADVNVDGKVSVTDLAKIKRVIVGLDEI